MTKNTSYNIPNITVYNKYWDGVQSGLRVIPDEDYVMYDTTDAYKEPVIDENGDIVFDDNGNIVEATVRQYFSRCDIPALRPQEPYNWVAVLKSEIRGNNPADINIMPN